MYKHYYINNNQTLNPGLHHEVHTKEHAAQLGIRSTQYVGYFASEVEAVAQAKKIYRCISQTVLSVRLSWWL